MASLLLIQQPVETNMRVYILLTLQLILAYFTTAQAAEQWLCTEASSVRSENIVKACGIGTAQTEDQARRRAFTHATHEFDLVCDSSEDCANHYYTTEAKRTTCEKVKDGYKCSRLVEFSIGKKRNPTDMVYPVVYLEDL